MKIVSALEGLTMSDVYCTPFVNGLTSKLAVRQRFVLCKVKSLEAYKRRVLCLYAGQIGTDGTWFAQCEEFRCEFGPFSPPGPELRSRYL